MVKTAQDVERKKQELEAKLAGAYGVKADMGVDQIAQAKEQLAELEQMKKVRLTVARDLTDPAIDKIYRRVAEWVKDAVVDIAVDSRVLGGAKVEFGGKYYDGTIKNRLEEYWSQHE